MITLGSLLLARDDVPGASLALLSISGWQIVVVAVHCAVIS